METLREDHRMEELNRSLRLVRPYLQWDGGDLEVVSVSRDGVVAVRLTGNCNGCGSSEHTLQAVVQDVLKGQLPWVSAVVEVDGDGESPAGAASGTRFAPPPCLDGLKGDHDGATARMTGLEQELLAIAPGSALPKAVEEWITFSRGSLRRHFELEEACVFPAFEMLFGGGGPLDTLAADHRQYFRLLDEFERTARDYRHHACGEGYALLLSSSRAMFRQLSTHFLREDGGLFTMIEEGLPNELLRELAADLSNHRRRTITEYAA